VGKLNGHLLGYGTLQSRKKNTRVSAQQPATICTVTRWRQFIEFMKRVCALYALLFIRITANKEWGTCYFHYNSLF
jgi:hypothetical protein